MGEVINMCLFLSFSLLAPPRGPSLEQNRMVCPCKYYTLCNNEEYILLTLHACLNCIGVHFNNLYRII